jgi:hypothetical protein
MSSQPTTAEEQQPGKYAHGGENFPWQEKSGRRKMKLKEDITNRLEIQDSLRRFVCIHKS